MANRAEELFYEKNSGSKNIKKSPPQEEFSKYVAADFISGRYRIISDFWAEQKNKVGELLEIGCGAGSAVTYLKRYAEHCVGMDIFIAPHLIKDPYPGVDFVEHNANDKFPFGSSQFDVVVAMMVMEHVFDPFFFAAECARVLKPGGILFINVPLLTSLKSRFALLFGKVPSTSSPNWYQNREWDGGHLHYFSLSLLKKLLVDHGFEIGRVQGVGRFHVVKTLFPTFLSSEISLACRKI